jgi:hypothetical protein
MEQKVSDNYFLCDECENDTVALVNSINDFILSHNCSELSLDISHLNIMDASKVTLVCSTYHWAKYPDGKINWKINSAEIEDLVKPMNLGNIRLITVQ